MNFRVIALIVAVPFLSYPAQAQDRQAVASPANVSKVFPASPAKVPLTKVSQTKASQVQAEQVEVSETQAPSFRKGLWRFVRTLDIVRNTNKNIKYRLANNEMTRCVDPTHSMKATFSSAPVGSCVSDKPEKVGNKYTFAKRCDYLGAVSTVITVHDDDSYTDLNELNGGESPKTDMVTAKRIGDCGDEKADLSARASVPALQQ